MTIGPHAEEQTTTLHRRYTGQDNLIKNQTQNVDITLMPRLYPNVHPLDMDVLTQCLKLNRCWLLYSVLSQLK